MGREGMSIYACSQAELDDLLDDFDHFYKIELGEVDDGPFGLGVNKLNGNGFPVVHSQQMHKTLSEGLSAVRYDRVLVFFTREGNECFPTEAAIATDQALSKLDRLRSQKLSDIDLGSIKKGPVWF
jgi:hypothetical protein